MRIVNELPPNFEQIAAVLPAARRPGVLFCYGDAIFYPTGGYLPPELLDHEAVHSKRQLALPGGPDEWWKHYLVSSKFRFDEELPAHIAEYAAVLRMTKNRRFRREYLTVAAGRLSGPLYGNMISLSDAERLIREGAAKA